MTNACQRDPGRGFFGHPSALSWLFTMEMCERFSYYGMRAILLYFIIDTGSNGGLDMSKPVGQALVAAYGASAYLFSILGGIVADRLVGLWKGALYGGVLIMAGHLVLTVPTSPLSWVGISCVAVGTGLLKPNLQSMFGSVYGDGDARRHGGFQLMYLSINVGAFVAPFIIGAMRSVGGYHAGFSAAAIGMAISMVIFLAGRRRMPAAIMRPAAPLSSQAARKLAVSAGAALVGVAALFLALLALLPKPTDAIVATVALVAAIASVAYFTVMLRSPAVRPEERTHVKAYLPLWICALMVWMIDEQAAVKMSSFALFNTDLRIGGVVIQPEWYQSINPLICILTAPVLAIWFTKRAGRFPLVAHKFVFGATLIAVSALLMGLAFATWDGGDALAPWWVLAAVFVLQTLGVVFISPVGASATTLLMPRRFKAQGMALWLLNNALAQGIAAVMIRLLADVSDAIFYYILAGATAAATLMLLALTPRITAQTRDAERSSDSDHGAQQPLSRTSNSKAELAGNP